MKNLITLVLCFLMIFLVYLNQDYLVESFTKYITNTDAVLPEEISIYQKDYSLSFVSSTENFTPYSYQDLMDILYTAINNGYDKFTFYCPDEYSSCKSDIEEISNDVSSLTHLNNFVHPYNSFTSIVMSISDLGEINVTITYLYTENEIDEINLRVQEIIDELITDDLNDEDKILLIHDYIINNAQYDISVNKNEESGYSSSTAYGALFEGYAICNGYTDLMAIFLNELDIKNIKIATTPEEISYSTTGHIWNAVYLNDTWLHLDLTWDDPVSEDGEDYLFYSYFLITSEDLYEKDNSKDVIYEEHNFNKVVYYEVS